MMSLLIHISFVEIVSIFQKEETGLEPKRAKGQQLNCETRQDSRSTTPGGSDKAHLLYFPYVNHGHRNGLCSGM